MGLETSNCRLSKWNIFTSCFPNLCEPVFKSTHWFSSIPWLLVKVFSHVLLGQMAHFHCRARIRIPNPGYMVLCRTCFRWLRFRFGSLPHSICIAQESVSDSESTMEISHYRLKMGWIILRVITLITLKRSKVPLTKTVTLTVRVNKA